MAAFGPFRVVDDNTAALVGITDSRAPAQFAALLQRYPQVGVLEFVEAPGTHDDRANLALGRMIRDHGIATRVEDGGSVRSGAVELFLAGATREIDPASEFAMAGSMTGAAGRRTILPGLPSIAATSTTMSKWAWIAPRPRPFTP